MNYKPTKQFKVMCLRESPGNPSSELCDTPEKVYNYWKTVIETPTFNMDQENFVVLCLNTRKRVTGWFHVAMGTLDQVVIHAREVFRGAIVNNSATIILIHNHPSGDPTPSEADIRVTRDLRKSGEILKIEVVDHVIIGEQNPSVNPRGYCSLRELGYFY